MYLPRRKELVAVVEHRLSPTLSWLQGKHADDVAEGLWRIRDKLYDLTDFAQRHPGGSFWIEQTKGTDITEPFESHHIEEHASRMLSKFEVRVASSPRNYQFTLEENGFYMTLKRRVRKKLQSLHYRPSRKTDVRERAITIVQMCTTSVSYSLFALLPLATSQWHLGRSLSLQLGSYRAGLADLTRLCRSRAVLVGHLLAQLLPPAGQLAHV